MRRNRLFSSVTDTGLATYLIWVWWVKSQASLLTIFTYGLQGGATSQPNQVMGNACLVKWSHCLLKFATD
jgi:hypothetical protein